MNYNAKKIINTWGLLIALLIAHLPLAANTGPWEAKAETSFNAKNADRQIIPDSYQTFAMDKSAMQSILRTAPERFHTLATEEEVVLQLPMPNGAFERFTIYYAPVLAPGLATRFPSIRSYAGIGLDDPTASVRFDLTPTGFHAMIISARHSTVFIDPYSKSDNEHYIVYYKKDFNKENSQFECLTTSEVGETNKHIGQLDGPARSLLQGDCQLRTYRLALTCTGEYAQFHGGTVEGVVAAMNTSMTRVNGVFEREVNVNMVIVDNNDDLIFLDAATDPFEDGDPGQMIDECHDQCVSIIGSDNFDMGHIFSTQGGGLAGLGVICSPNRKGNGVTGINNPVGDPFDIDYVAHEMGHQFGAGHTQNNDCNRSGFSAMEPGSASTIMGYAGICSPNVQTNSDDYFHAISIQQISNYINNGNGDSCPAYTITGNTPPTVEDVPNYTLPISTPFYLTAIGDDADGNAITYCWEQMDNEVATMPPVSTNIGGPAFRSFNPTENPTRYFPRLSDLVNGTNYDWEELPSVARDMNFRVTLRDNNMGSGCTIEDDVELTFTADAGPFVVQSPNTTVSWTIGSYELVSWDVANTDLAPVSCTNVDLLLSLDGGFTYPVTLVSNVPNTGFYEVEVPNELTTTARVMVVCSDNIFFDISDQDFSIEEPLDPAFALGAMPNSYEVCGSVESVDFELNLASLAGFNEQVNLSTSGVPANAMATFSENNIVPTASSILTIGNLTAVENGTYTIMLTANAASVSVEKTLVLTVTNGSPQATTLTSPSNGAPGQLLNPTLSWNAIDMADAYNIEIATSPAFGADIIESSTLAATSYTPQNLSSATVYYWRIAGINICGEGGYSPWFAFQTDGVGCNIYTSEDVPVSIPVEGENTISASITIADNFELTTMTTSLEVAHSYIGDLDAFLIAPDAIGVSLFDRPGVDGGGFGCDADNLLLTFDDEATDDAVALEETCEGGNYAIAGTFQPIEALNTFAGTNVTGTWTLEITDNADQDGGQLESFRIELCFNTPIGATPDLINNTLTVEPGATQPVPNSNLLATSAGHSSADITYVLLDLPTEGTLTLNGEALAVGRSFTQEDIDNNVLVYTNTNGTATQDQFTFDVLTPDGGWIANEIFLIEFGTVTVSATAFVSQEVLCSGTTEGEITVNSSGTNPPFEYSLNGAGFQSANIFADLPAGTYVIEVMDAVGNTIETNTVILEDPTIITASASTVGNDLIIEATGGTGILSYSIDGENYQESNMFFDLPNSTYEVIVVDENDCETSVSVVINLIESVLVITEPPTCANGEDGMLAVTEVMGGEAPYEYSIDGQTFSESNVFLNLLSGGYTVLVRDANGDVFEAGTFMIVDPSPIMFAIEAAGNSIIVPLVVGLEEAEYSIDGGMTFQASNTFSDLENGVYVITIRDENGCVYTSEEITINIVGLHDLQFDLSFRLFPNPVSTELTLELNQATAQNISIKIFDVAGRLIQDLKVSKSTSYLKTAIDVKALPAGSYELLLSDGLVKGRARFVKM